MESYDICVVSLGAGTQSSALLMLALRGELPSHVPPVDAAIFADTGDEPQAVYDYLGVLEAECERYGVPLVRVQHKDGPLSEQVTDTERPWLPMIPASTAQEDGRAGRTSRFCTSNVKTQVVRREIKRLMGVSTTRGTKALQLIGLSADEADRISPPDVKWLDSAWPLAVDLGWRRQDSINYLQRLGMPEPPRSACVYCPLMGNREWRNLRDNHPEDFQRAVAFDYRLREANRERREKGLDSVPGDLFVHRSGLPLDEAPLDPDTGGIESLFGEECEGVCGI